jgi:alcohol dehydrogenase class IV
VHAIAHQFGGLYHTPHGLANAILLPHVLRYSLPAIAPRLALLAVRARVGDEGEDEDLLAQKFIDAVQQLNDDLGIPRQLDALREADIPALARAACAEGNTYPVPRYLTQEGCEALIRQVLPAAPPARKAAPAKTARKPAAAKKARARAAH